MGASSPTTTGYVNVRDLGAVGDGINDDTNIINDGLQQYDTLIFPPGIYRVTDTIKVGTRGKSIVGSSYTVRGYGGTATIKYDGNTDDTKAVVILGHNSPTQSPSVDGSNNCIKNINIDASMKAGFCLFATYITNESIVDNIVLEGSLEYNAYFSKGWYASIANLTSLSCRNNGIALGMPLIWSNGQEEPWSTSETHVLNNIFINNIRSHSSGGMYSQDSPGSFDPTDVNMLKTGYGIGAGRGNGFNMNGFVSERSGGVNLYVYTGYEPIKSITNGYMELACFNSDTDQSSVMCCMVIDNGDGGGEYKIDNIYSNYNSGGIYYIGGEASRSVKISNIRQPRFLKSLSGLSEYELHKKVIKDSCYYLIGYTNTDDRYCYPDSYMSINSIESWTMPTTPYYGGRKILLVKYSGGQPGGNVIVHRTEGSDVTLSLPGVSGDDWAFVAFINGDSDSVSHDPNSEYNDTTFHLRVMNCPWTS